MTKHESISDCYDNVDNCQELTFNCHKYGKHCKKTCGLCGEETPHPSNTCWDEYRDCPERAKTKCHKVGKNCKRVREGAIFWSSYKYLNTQSCGLCPGMTRHPTNDCGDTSTKDCAKHAEDSCYQAHIAKECCLSCGLGR